MRIILWGGLVWDLFKVMAVCALWGSASVCVTCRLSLAPVSEASGHWQGQAGIWGANLIPHMVQQSGFSFCVMSAHMHQNSNEMLTAWTSMCGWIQLDWDFPRGEKSWAGWRHTVTWDSSNFLPKLPCLVFWLKPGLESCFPWFYLKSISPCHIFLLPFLFSTQIGNDKDSFSIERIWLILSHLNKFFEV